MSKLITKRLFAKCKTMTDIKKKARKWKLIYYAGTGFCLVAAGCFLGFTITQTSMASLFSGVFGVLLLLALGSIYVSSIYSLGYCEGKLIALNGNPEALKEESEQVL